jgi:superfamily II DNA/RNA helicase
MSTNENFAEEDFSYKEWDELDLDPNLLRGIFAYGFEKPSPIQQKAIKPIMMKRDVVVQAQSGTGKTATFAIGALANVNTEINSTQILVLSPTKELTIQTAKVFESLGSMLKNLRVQTCYGGSVIEDVSSFSDITYPHVICGCTGRVNDMFKRNKISPKQIKLLILDETDEMLSYSFKDQVQNIYQYLNNDLQVVLVSATLPDHILSIIDKIVRDPVRISVKRQMLTLEGISQFYVAIEDDRQKYLTLKDIFNYLSGSQCIIYCNSIKRVQELYEAMKEDEYPVCRIHGNMDKIEREKTFFDFRTGASRVLISSNVTARGIDIQQVSIVVNFDLPKCVNTYLHRIGRSGRWGRKGVGINFVTRRDIDKMREIEGHYSTQINELPSELKFLSNL